MTIVAIILAVMLCIMVGFAARQMQDLRDNAAEISGQDLQIKGLLRAYDTLLREKRDLEATLAARDKSA